MRCSPEKNERFRDCSRGPLVDRNRSLQRSISIDVHEATQARGGGKNASKLDNALDEVKIFLAK